MPDRIVLLGAEKQAATSAARAYPEHQFRFVSDQPVLDGWDLPNVTFTYGTPGNVAIGHDERIIALCPRWLPADRQRPLSEVFPILNDVLSGLVLPVSTDPLAGQEYIVKGDHWHRPDGTITGIDLDPHDVGDPYGCGTLYQAFWRTDSSLLAVGQRTASALQIALIQIHSESCARDDILAAGETIRPLNELAISRSIQALEAIEHIGPFSMNWVLRGDQYRLTSFRPVPRALFGTLRKAGIDLLDSVPEFKVADAGHRFVGDITYTSYRRLAA